MSEDNMAYVKKRLAADGIEADLKSEMKEFLNTKPKVVFDVVSDVLDMDDIFVKQMKVKMVGKEKEVKTMYTKDPILQEEWLTMDFPDTYPKDHETKPVNITPAERARRATGLNRHVENEIYHDSITAKPRAEFIDYKLDDKLNQ